MLEPRSVFLAIAPDTQFQPVGQGVHNGNTHTVQTTRDLVRVAVELTASMQLGHDDLCRRDALFWVDIDRNTPAVVRYRDTGIGMDFYGHMVRVTGQCLVDAVVHDLVHHMVQARAIIRVPDIHTGALADSL